ncbi:MAG: aminotransferase class I/II-fold pyridoxal phosphate-dependent enzyme [Anaerolineaceae bacterium]|nr:aminotransferase class I/II-fold pyridoxal phosphate-dependent enzyme [Anaerolineaceae bacterium]MDE0328214.1 aminotransferase class I/II-fold pyridoxal phosphate-dependent enzyme [Anaerolineaceae bacterium]
MPERERKKSGTNLLYSMMAEAASYDDAVILGRGDPDFDTPEHIIAAAKEAMVQHHSDTAPPEGLPALREAIAARVERVSGVAYDPATEVVVTNGGQEALFLMVLTLIGPGDEMVVPEPNYNTYLDSTRFAGGRQIEVDTFPHQNFRADPADVRRAVNERTKALLLVSPNNPAASVISPQDMRDLAQIACDHDLFIISDEIYDLFVYDDVVHTSAAAMPGARERTLTLNALSKAYSMTGWRVGWVTGPAPLMERLRELKAAITGATSIISQYAGIAALTGPQEPVQMFADTYVRRRRVVLDALDEMGIEYGVPEGGQFIFADIGFTGLDSMQFAQRVLSEQHVLVYPGSAFSEARKQYIRMTFLQPEGTLREGMERMKFAMEGIRADIGNGSAR